jgi:multidrug efflux pump subunit AcrB
MTSNLIGALVTRRRLVLAVATLMALSGLVAWATMPRQEDPRFANRFAIVIAPYPGADPEKIERLVVERIEEQLSDVEAIKRVISQAQTGVALINIELSSSVAASETTAAWDEVRRALERARRELPRGVGTPVLDDKISNNVSVLLAVSGEKTPRDLMKDVRSLERRLLGFRGVARVILVGEPKEQVIVEYDDSTARRYGISAHKLGRALRSRNANLPGGSVVLGARRATLDPDTSFNSLDEIRRLPVALPKGNATVALSQLASVRFGVASPARPRMRHDGRPAVGLGIVATQGIDQVAFGKALREQIAKLRSQYKGLAISEVTFQPQRVETRLTNLRGSLLLGVAVLGSILILAMGIRLGLLVSLIVPLVALSSLAVYAMGGGVLHQISIAGLVIALGMLVDNAIVVAEDIQRRLDEGISRSQAAVATIRELSFPLATATATTLAAFVPMLMSKGNTADFTRALPIVVMLSLVVSYVFALAVTPALGAALLRPNRNVAKADSPKGWLFRVSSQLSAVATARPKLTLLIVMLLVVGSLALAPMVPRQFFPSSDRDQLLVSVELPVGTKLERTATLSRPSSRRALLGRDDVRSVSAFIGRSAPRFYYNVRAGARGLRMWRQPGGADALRRGRGRRGCLPGFADTRFQTENDLAARASGAPSGLEQGPPILSAGGAATLFGDVAGRAAAWPVTPRWPSCAARHRG